MRPGTSGRGALIPIHERPMTQQGVGGPPKTGVQGTSGRMVQDKSFWIGEIKQRMTWVATESTKVSNDIDQFEKENATFVSLERRAQTTSQELRDIQGQLGDYNTLIDKLHTDTDLEDIQKLAKELNVKNTREQQSVDSIFMERRSKEQAIKELEVKLANEKENLFRCISQLGEEAKAEWSQLEAEKERFQKLLIEKQQLLSSLNEKKKTHDKRLYQDPVRQKTWQLLDRKTHLDHQLQELYQLEKAETMDTKESLLQSIKQTQNEVQNLESHVMELEKKDLALQNDIDWLTSESTEEKLAKYEELMKKDQEMTQFLASFNEEVVQPLLQHHQNFHRSIVQGLTEIHRLATAVIGTPQELKTVDETVKEKEKEFKQTEFTVDTLMKEKEKLKQDLEKVQGLGAKLEKEKVQFLEKKAFMEQALLHYQQVDAIKSELNEAHQQWKDFLLSLQQQAGHVHRQLQDVESKFEMKTCQLKDNETYRTLHGLAIKWRSLHASNSEWINSIQHMTDACDYLKKKEDTLALVDMCLAQNVKLAGLSMIK
ncbi:Intraflagellar transport protein 74 [Coelomomyces lativittatus]|nr:Intraflagellar transport protein 74 [Coelomomyces lativittatus]